MSTNTREGWTREQKEEYAQKRMAEMKLKNDMLKRRHAEVEFDRLAAEKQNSSVTKTLKAVKKDIINDKHENYENESKIEYEREWDRGKPNRDNWNSPEHCGNWMYPDDHLSIKNIQTGFRKRDFGPKASFDTKSENHNVRKKDLPTGNRFKTYTDRKDSKDNFPQNKSYDYYKYGQPGDNRMKSKRDYRYKQYENQHSSSYHYKSLDKRRGYGYRSNESYRKSHVYSEEKYKKFDFHKSYSKKFSRRAHSESTSRSDSDHVDNVTNMKISSMRVESLWQNDKESEDQAKHSRTENWVKSVSGQSYSKICGINQHSENSDQGFDKEGLDSDIAAIGEIKSVECTTAHKSESKISPPTESCFSKQYDRIKGFKSKRSPQSITSSKNEHASKQGRFDVNFKDEDQIKFPKFKQESDMNSKANSRNNSAVRNRNLKNKKHLMPPCHNFVKAYALNECKDDSYEKVVKKESHVDDGLWESAEQTDIKWQLSDDESTEVKSEDLTSRKKKYASSDVCSDNKFSPGKKNLRKPSEIQQQNNYRDQAAKIDDDDDQEDIWAKFNTVCIGPKGVYHEAPKSGIASLDHVELSKSKNDLPKLTEAFKWEQDIWDPNYISEKMKEKCKISDEMETNQDKTATGSDDGWLTESEEGEIQSDNDEKSKKSIP